MKAKSTDAVARNFKYNLRKVYRFEYFSLTYLFLHSVIRWLHYKLLCSVLKAEKDLKVNAKN